MDKYLSDLLPLVLLIMKPKAGVSFPQGLSGSFIVFQQ